VITVDGYLWPPCAISDFKVDCGNSSRDRLGFISVYPCSGLT
jgi:hypothetical protein